MGVKAIIPFKKEGAKLRLGDFLTENEREELAISMLKDVLVALSESKIDEVEIITTGSRDEIEKEAQLNGALDLTSTLKVSVREDERGLNEVLNEAITEEKEPTLILMADVPLTTPESINEIIKHEEVVVIVPGRKGGTNALFLRRPYAFSVAYYGLSFSKHIETAKRRNLSHAVYDSFFISADIDEVEDLIELLIHGRGFSADYLRRIGVFLNVDKNSKSRAVVDRK
ncbi:MAG: 2-phospho-L-lactate guanylyltransferase [Methanosarcinales archaeon]|nr:2-phospho-L-lactate guanylyltransferase [Methanosarcinales archaeon]